MTIARIQLWILLSAICISVVYGKPPWKISDGEKVRDVPYQVAIQDTFLLVHCGGAIIDARHILTSAHCIVDESGRALFSDVSKIIVGTINVLNQTEQNEYNISEGTVHKGYNASDSFHNDIAIIKLDRAIEFTRDQKPISLPVNDTIEGTSVTATGWGAIEYDESRKIVGPYPRLL